MTAAATEFGSELASSEEQLRLAARGPWRLLWGRLRRKRLAMISLVIIAIIYGGGITAPLVAPYAYTTQNLDRGLEGPSADHWFGTDRLGRDMFSRVLYSARTTLIVTAAVVLSGTLILGNLLGLLAGYRGGWVDSVIMRIGDVFASLPGLPMLILLNATLLPRVLELVGWVEDRHVPRRHRRLGDGVVLHRLRRARAVLVGRHREADPGAGAAAPRA